MCRINELWSFGLMVSMLIPTLAQEWKRFTLDRSAIGNMQEIVGIVWGGLTAPLPHFIACRAPEYLADPNAGSKSDPTAMDAN